MICNYSAPLSVLSQRWALMSLSAIWGCRCENSRDVLVHHRRAVWDGFLGMGADMIDPWTAAFALNRAEKERLDRAVQERREIAKEIGK